MGWYSSQLKAAAVSHWYQIEQSLLKSQCNCFLNQLISPRPAMLKSWVILHFYLFCIPSFWWNILILFLFSQYSEDFTSLVEDDMENVIAARATTTTKNWRSQTNRRRNVDVYERQRIIIYWYLNYKKFKNL